VIGLSTGTFLYFLSTLLTAILSLNSPSDETGRTAASVRATRQKKRIEALQESSNAQARIRIEETLNMKREYESWLEKDRKLGRGGAGLLARSQTILEEEDDSDDGFY
jgi:hypothetical protein